MNFFTIFTISTFCFCKVSEKSKLFPNFVFKDVVKNDHLGTGGQTLPDQQEPLETGFDIFPYVKVIFLFFPYKNLKIFKNKGGSDEIFL